MSKRMDKLAMDKLTYEQFIDDILYDEYNTKKSDVMLPCVFYKLTGKLWRSVYCIYINNYERIDIPEDENKDSNHQDYVYIDILKTYNNFIKNNWVYKDILYSKYFFKDHMVAELEATSCTIYFDNDKDNTNIIKEIQGYLVKNENNKTKEVGLLTKTPTGGYATKYLEFDKMDIDIDKCYNNDIPLERIYKFIEEDNTGLALFYGEPGTGKTTFIKYLIQKFNDKNFIVLDSDLLADISNKELISYFIDESESIFIIEDAEKLLSSREHTYNPVISSFLNMSDGIIASTIKSKFICTFNTSLSNIDKALQRKGRMKVKYEFGKLKLEKAIKINPKATKDTCVADLFYDAENDFSKKEIRKIGF